MCQRRRFQVGKIVVLAKLEPLHRAVYNTLHGSGLYLSAALVGRKKDKISLNAKRMYEVNQAVQQAGQDA